MRHEFKGSHKKSPTKTKKNLHTQTLVLPFCNQLLISSLSVPPFHNCACPASCTATPWVGMRIWWSSGLTIPGLAGMRLTFFRAARMVLFCGFGTNTGLMFYLLLSSVCTAPKVFFFFFFPQWPSSKQRRSWEETQPRQVARGIFYAIGHHTQQ